MDDKKKSDTERYPLERTSRMEDMAEMASFLLSDRSTWITGRGLRV